MVWRKSPIQRLSLRSFSANRVTSETESSAFLTTGGAMIERLENTPEILMQAPIRRAFSQSTFAALACPSSSDDRGCTPHKEHPERQFASPNTRGFRRVGERGKLGPDERKTGSFGGLFNARSLM